MFVINALHEVLTLPTVNTTDLLPCYLIIGSDELKRNAAVTKLKSYIQPELQDFCLDELSADTIEAPNQLIGSLETIPFMGDMRLVIVHNIGAASKDIQEALVAYLENPNPSSVLCLEGETLAKNTRLYKAVAKVGPKSVVKCGGLKKWELPQYVMKLGTRLGLNVDNAAAAELVNRIGENTVALENQLNTLRELFGQGATITKAVVQKNVAQVAEVAPWGFVDALSERNVAEAMQLLNAMAEPNYVFLQVLVAKRIRELICASSLAKRGNTANLAAELKLAPWQVKNHARWVRNFTDTELLSLLSAAEDCEAALKGSPDSETAFITFILKFAK